MIFVDSNIPMYLVGAEHPNKGRTVQLLERCINDQERLVTDVLVFQEILHRYVAIDRRDAIPPAFEVLAAIVDDVYDITLRDVQRAKDIVLNLSGLSARDALHTAVMERHGVERLMSFDAGFDHLPGPTRIS